jgi:hypothetical protein
MPTELTHNADGDNESHDSMPAGMPATRTFQVESSGKITGVMDAQVGDNLYLQGSGYTGNVYAVNGGENQCKTLMGGATMKAGGTYPITGGATLTFCITTDITMFFGANGPSSPDGETANGSLRVGSGGTAPHPCPHPRP